MDIYVCIHISLTVVFVDLDMTFSNSYPISRAVRLVRVVEVSFGLAIKAVWLLSAP